MKISFRLIPLMFPIAFLLAGCAAGGARDADGRPQLERLSASTVVAPRPERLGLNDLAALERTGRSPREIVERLRAQGQRFAMDVPQQKQLRAAGGSAALVDALVTAEAQARRADRLTKEADEAAARRDEARREAYYRDYYYYPYWGGFYPYVGYGRYHGWYGGAGWYW